MVKEQLNSELHPPSAISPKSTQNSDNFSQVATLFARKENYLKELSKRRLDTDQGVDELAPKKQGHPPLLETELDHPVQLYVKELRANGAIISTAIVIATGEGIVQHHDMNLLAKHRGSIAITKPWAQPLLTRMHFRDEVIQN